MWVAAGCGPSVLRISTRIGACGKSRRRAYFEAGLGGPARVGIAPEDWVKNSMFSTRGIEAFRQILEPLVEIDDKVAE